ncbi:hypothetical protein [Paludibaculum fermentans]|uniref:hypothetical protein n=1 Tax=Paludibaculum fermentans TaxID=1473598 RepID=UPI003EBF8656
MSIASSSSGPMAAVVCAHLDSVERRLLARPSVDEIQEIQNELELVITLVRSFSVPVMPPGILEHTFRPMQTRLRRLSALLEQALSFCDGWQSFLGTQAGYNPAGAWNAAPPASGLLDHRG